MRTIKCATEAQAKTERRAYIYKGYAVSLIGFNPESNKYEFDVLR